MKIRARVMTIVFVLIVATIAIVNAAMPSFAPYPEHGEIDNIGKAASV